jgi:hypothetical protein
MVVIWGFSKMKPYWVSPEHQSILQFSFQNCEVLFNQSSGYDVYRHHVVLCIIVAMMSIDVTNVSNYSVVNIRPVGRANLYTVLARCFSYFRVWQEVVDCSMAVLGSTSFD